MKKLIAYLFASIFVTYLFYKYMEEMQRRQSLYVVDEGELTPETKIIIFGENHNYYNSITIPELEKISLNRPDDLFETILLESLPLGQEIDCLARNIPRKENRKCIGWDDMEAFSVYIDIKYKQELLFDISHFILSGETETNVDRMFKKRMKNFKKTEEEKYGIRLDTTSPLEWDGPYSLHREITNQVMIEYRAGISILNDRRTGKHYAQIIAELPKPVSENIADYIPSETPANKRHCDTYTKRGTSAVKALTLFSNGTTYLVAGKQHTHESGRCNAEGVQILNAALQSNKKTRPYVMLVLNDLKPNLRNKVGL